MKTKSSSHKFLQSGILFAMIFALVGGIDHFNYDAYAKKTKSSSSRRSSSPRRVSAPKPATVSRNTQPKSATIGGAKTKAVPPKASNANPSTGQSRTGQAPAASANRNTQTKSATIGGSKTTAKASTKPAPKLSAADQKMASSVKRKGKVQGTRAEAKTAALKSNPKLDTKEGLRSETNTFKEKPTEAPSYMSTSVSHNGSSYNRELYQDPVSSSYSYRYRSTTGDLIEAMAIASIYSSAQDHAFYRSGYHYHGSPYSPHYNNYTPRHSRPMSFWGFLFGAIFIVTVGGFVALVYMIQRTTT